MLALSHQVTDAIAQLPAKSRPLFCFAGNSWTTNEVLAYWQEQAAGSTAKVVANVLGPGRRSAMALHSTLGQYYWQHSLDVPAMRQIAAWVHQPAELRSSQWAFVQAVRLWTDFQGLPELHGLYAGADRWLHVWASQEHGEVRVCFVRPKEDPSFLADWPPLRLVSGEWPAQWPRPSTYWWDPAGVCAAGCYCWPGRARSSSTGIGRGSLGQQHPASYLLMRFGFCAIMFKECSHANHRRRC